LDGINTELKWMNDFFQDAREKNFEIHSAIPELTQAYTGLIIR
jgi:hypothetical protein